MTARQHGARHRAARVGVLRRLWLTVAVLSAAVLAGALAAGGSYALLASQTTASAGTVRSGAAAVTVEPQGPLQLQGLLPGGSVLTTVSVTNRGDVPLKLDAQATELAAAWDSRPGTTAAGASLDELRLNLTAVPSAAQCRAGMRGTSQYVRSWATPTAIGSTLPKGQSRTYCVELLLDTDAPAAVQGAVDGFTLLVTGRQVRA